MGYGISFCCETCKKEYYLGYGSGTNTIWADNIIKFENESDQIKKLTRNKNLLKCLKEHRCHKYFQYNNDDLHDYKGQLISDDGNVYIKDYSKYEYINLEDNTKEK